VLGRARMICLQLVLDTQCALRHAVRRDHVTAAHPHLPAARRPAQPRGAEAAAAGAAGEVCRRPCRQVPREVGPPSSPRSAATVASLYRSAATPASFTPIRRHYCVKPIRLIDPRAKWISATAGNVLCEENDGELKLVGLSSKPCRCTLLFCLCSFSSAYVPYL
jgi:hypothetical protein